MGFISRIIKKLINRGITLLTLSFLYPLIYKKHSKNPVDESKVLFLIIRKKGLTDNFRILYDTLKNETDYTLHCHFLESDSVSKKEYIRRCTAYIKDLATAKYVFLDEATHLTGKTDIRTETFITQLWHGCGAFKKFGYSTVDSSFGANKTVLDRYPPNKGYSLVTVSSAEVIPHFEGAMGYSDKKGIVKATGCSRTDKFFDKEYIDKAYSRLYELFPAAKDKRIILYAPTYRGNVEHASHPDMLDIKKLSSGLSDEYVLITKYHPVVKNRPEIPVDTDRNFAFDFTDKMSINELLCVTDICISDYSSLIFEYSLFEKPMIFFAYDLDEYLDERGFYYIYDEFVPGPVAKNTEEIIEYIRKIDKTFDKKTVIDFKEKFMDCCDGKATRRIIADVFGSDYLNHKKI